MYYYGNNGYYGGYGYQNPCSTYVGTTAGYGYGYGQKKKTRVQRILGRFKG